MGSPVQQCHKFIFVPLLYTKMTDRYIGQEMDRNKATNKIYHQAYSKFEEYNLLVNIENVNNLGSKSE